MIFSVILDDVLVSDGLLVALNEINRQLTYAKTLHFEGKVHLQATMRAEGLVLEPLSSVFHEVVSAAHIFDTVLQKQFGGRMSFDDPGEVIDA